MEQPNSPGPTAGAATPTATSPGAAAPAAPPPAAPPRERPHESLTIVLPAYNEAERIGPALDELFQFLDDAANVGEVAGIPEKVEVLVVDDGSRDGTGSIVSGRREAQPNKALPDPRLRLVRAKHAGKGAAVRTGMLAAKGDLVIFTDADMATPPDQLPKLVAALRNADVALGSRI